MTSHSENTSRLVGPLPRPPTRLSHDSRRLFRPHTRLYIETRFDWMGNTYSIYIWNKHGIDFFGTLDNAWFISAGVIPLVESGESVGNNFFIFGFTGTRSSSLKNRIFLNTCSNCLYTGLTFRIGRLRDHIRITSVRISAQWF